MAGHSHFSPANVEEKFDFTLEGKKKEFSMLSSQALLL